MCYVTNIKNYNVVSFIKWKTDAMSTYGDITDDGFKSLYMLHLPLY